jgi:tape measure domain-containing protein
MAQLELSVVLNLANFRTQLGKLAQASAAYYYPINLTIDKQAFKKQLAALGNIKTTLNINDSQIDAARARIGTLNKSLATLRRATSTPIEIKLKYVEVGKPSSAAAGQIGRAVSGGVRGGQAVESFSYKQLQATRQMMQAAKMPVGSLGGGRSVEAYLNSIVEGFKNASEESINGLASGLKSGNSEIATAAKKVGEAGVRAIKDSLGIASPSRVFKQIGEFSVDGLELGFLNGLKDFKSKSIAEIKKIVALMRFELAKVSDVSGVGGPSMGSLRRQLVGQRAYTSPIGPQPLGSKTPWAAGSAGQLGSSGFEPRMVSRPYGQAFPAAPGSFLQFSRSAGQPQSGSASPTGGTPGSFRSFSQRATNLSFPVGGMAYPSSPVQSGQSSRLASPLGAGYFAVGKGLKEIESAYGQVKNFLNTKNLPVIGAIADLGSEFGNAIKQVLLFGTAYKALAFLTSLPGEAFEAAKGLATYKNQLQAVTAESGTFEQSFAFVDGLATRFNVPLDSARQGFVKLYASMQPAGFSQGQIENLFTGISKAAAAFGLSSDKVDRVNYAFAQMASKGQIMSEELKGQLGDVLPGALGLFAKAAQMSIPEFSKAMEDGAFKGKAMEQVLGNVATLLNNKFGAAAEGAAKTLQGAVNQIQNNLALMYQSFSPIVDGVAAAFGPQVNALIKDVTETVKVLTGTFTQTGEGFDTLSPRAQAFYAAIQTLRPSLEQAGAALLDLGSRLASLLPAFIQVIAATISFAASPLGRSALIAAVAVSTLTAALKLLEVTGIKAAIKAVYAFIGGLLKIPAATGVARVAIIGLKLALTGVFVGAVLMGLDFLIGKLLNIGDAANDSANDIRGMSKELDAMAGAGDIEGTSKAFLEANTKLAAARKANQKALDELKTAKNTPIEDSGSVLERAIAVRNAEDKVNKTFEKVVSAQGEVTAARKSRANAVVLKEQQEKQTEQQLEKIDLSGEDEASKKKTSLESYYSLQDQLAKAQTQADIERLEAEFEHKRAMINAEYDLKEAKANSFQKKAIAFQKEIFAITSEQDAALFKNRNKVLAAAGSVAGGAGGGAPVASSGYIDKSVLQTFLASQGFGRTTGDYTNKGHATPNHTLNAMDMGILGGSDADALRRTIAMERQLSATGAFGNQLFGPERDPYGHGAGKGGQNIHLHIPTPGGKVKMTPGLASLMNYSGPTSAGSTPGKVTPSRKRDELAEQQVTLTAREMNAAAVEKEAEAIAKLEIAVASYVQSLVPTAEQALQNQLLQQRITLTQNSFSPEILEAQLAFAEQELQVAESIKLNTERINELTAAGSKDVKGIKALTDANNQLKANLPVSAIQLLTKTINEEVDSLVSRTNAAQKDAISQEKVSSLIIGGMTRQAAEAKVAAANLRSNYQEALARATKQVEIAAAAEEVLAAARRLGKKETAEQTAEYNRLAQALKDAKDKKDKLEKRAPEVEGAATGIESSVAPKTTSSYIADGLSAAQEKLDQLTNTGYQVVQAANAIGDAFGTAFKGVITGSMTAREALAGMFQSVADHFADMVAQMIAEYLKMALIKGIMSLIPGLGSMAGGLSGAFGTSGPSFNAGAFSGSALSSGAAFGGAGAGNFSSAFSGGAAAFNPAAFSVPKFANGGIVTGPTLGLVGEGRYNEAVIPLPDGKSVPVQLSGGDGGNQMNTNITVNVSNGQAQSNATGSNSSELGRKIEGAVKQVIVGELRPGGLLASR